MSLIRSNAVQIGQSSTATQNFTLSVPSSPNGTIKLARGNSGSTTQDVLSVDASGNIDSLVKSTGSTASRSLANRFADVVNVKDFLCNDGLPVQGDGIHDDTTGIQAALSIGKPIMMPEGRYRVTSELVWSDGSFLFSHQTSVFYQNTSNFPVIGTVAEIYYDGAGGTNSCVCRMSKVSVGIKPVYQVNESQTLRYAGIEGIYINGNNKAEYGLYSARAGLGNTYNNLSVSNTTKHGFWFGELWNCNIGTLFAIYNYGCGISIGIDTFTWSGGNTVNGITIDGLIAYKNGQSLTSWTTGDYLLGYGIGYAPGRTCVLNYADSEYNNGVGLVWSPTSGPQQITAFYQENNCQSADSSNRWAIWYLSNSNSLNATLVNSYHLFAGASGNTNASRIKITGTPPNGISKTNKSYLTLGNITGILVIDADFGDYRVEQYQMTSTSRIVSHYPQYNDPDTITSNQTTLYVGLNATGTGSGINSSNLISGLNAAIRVASVVSSITTIDYSSVTGIPSSAILIDGTNINKKIIISGGTTGRFNAVSGTAITFTGFNQELTIDGFSVIDRSYFKDGRYVLNDCPIIRMDASNTTGAAVNVDNSNLQISGNSVINVSASSAATKIGISVEGNSQVTFSNAAAGTIVSASAGKFIEFNAGGGYVSVSITTATATWAASSQVTRNSGGGAGIILAPNGLNP